MLFNIFKKKTYKPTNEKFKLAIVDDQATKVHEVLGINEEKAAKMAEICLEAYEKYDNKIDSIQHILDNCVHINEVILSMMIYEKIHETKISSNRLRNILKLW